MAGKISWRLEIENIDAVNKQLDGLLEKLKAIGQGFGASEGARKMSNAMRDVSKAADDTGRSVENMSRKTSEAAKNLESQAKLGNAKLASTTASTAIVVIRPPEVARMSAEAKLLDLVQRNQIPSGMEYKGGYQALWMKPYLESLHPGKESSMSAGERNAYSNWWANNSERGGMEHKGGYQALWMKPYLEQLHPGGKSKTSSAQAEAYSQWWENNTVRTLPPPLPKQEELKPEQSVFNDVAKFMGINPDSKMGRVGGVALGAAASAFSPWIGATMISSALKAPFAAVYVATEMFGAAVKKAGQALEYMKQSAERNAELMRASRLSPLSAGQLMRRRLAGSAAGLSDSESDTLSGVGNYGVMGKLIASGGAYQKMLNATEYVERAYKRLAPDMAQADVDFKRISVALTTVKETVVVSLLPAIQVAADALEWMAKKSGFIKNQVVAGAAGGLANAMFPGLGALAAPLVMAYKAMVGNTEVGTDGKPKTTLAGYRADGLNSFQRMGFVMGNVGTQGKDIREIAINTGTMVKLLSRFAIDTKGENTPLNPAFMRP